MKKNILKVTLVAVFSLVAGYNVYCSQKSAVISSLALANIEVLASGEGGGGNHTCYDTWRKAPDDNSLAYWDWICQECEAYWLEYGRNRSSC